MKKYTALAEILSLLPFVEDVENGKNKLDALRPLSQEAEGRVMQKLRLDWNFHSNAIEGNKLTYGETYTFLMHGLTAKGKPLKDHLDIKGHSEAIDFLVGIVKDTRDLTEAEIRELHKMILVEPFKSKAQTAEGQATTKLIQIGVYKTMPNHVLTQTGETHYYADPKDVPALMQDLVQWYNEARHNPKIHPSVLAAIFHHRFVAIHPFDDGNGRLARILMNLILMQKGFPPAVVKLKERSDYYAALAQADKGEYTAICEFVAETALDSINLCIKAAKGENIDEDEDIDKEIALLKKSFDKKVKFNDNEEFISIIHKFFIPILDKGNSKLKELDDFFVFNNKEYVVSFYICTESFVDDEKCYMDSSEHIEQYETIEDVLGTYSKDKKYKDFETDIIYIRSDITYIRYNYKWTNFNRSKQGFNFSTYISIMLIPNGFIIGYPEFEKEYHFGEPLSQITINEIANNWIRISLEKFKKEL